jgi:hypothetical protein
MMVRQYVPEDRAMVSDWLAEHRAGVKELPEWVNGLLGVIIEDDSGPACSLFVLETYRSPWAILDWPVTRPGMSRKQSREVLTFAVECLMKLAGKCVEPPAEYTAFLALPQAPLVKIMERMGFQRLYSMDSVPMVKLQGT